MRTHSILSILALLAAFVFAPAARAATIAELVAHPDAYDGQTVTVTGTVDIALPVGTESAYYLRDGATKITVVSRNAPPAANAALSVSGTMRVFHEGDGGPEENKFPPWIFETARTPAP